MRHFLRHGLCCIALAATAAAAADFDGSKPFLCASIEASDCTSGQHCEKGLPADLNLPQFVRVDFGARSISASGRTSAIQNVTRGSGMLVMQGTDQRRAWSITVDEQTGRLVAAVAGDDEAFVVFGACTLP